MRIDLTPEQAAEIANPFWDIAYQVTLDDGTILDGNYADDLVQEIPAAEVIIGELAAIEDAQGNVTGYACVHSDLTDEDAVLIKMVLDWRALQMATIAALPAADRPAARSALRTQVRTDARQAARRADRVQARIAARTAERVEDRVAARREARRLQRVELRQQAVDAGLLPA